MSEKHGSGHSGWLGDERVREALLYAGLLLITLLAAYWLLELGRTNLHVLWRNNFDAYSVAESVKGFILHGSFVTNPSVGAPGTLNMLDYPGADLLHLVFLGAIGLLTRDAPMTVNLYYLLGYPLAAMAALFVLRRFGVSRPSAFVASVLFAFMPYHYLRGDAHLYLSEYYLVPFVFLLALQVDGRRPPFFETAEDAPGGLRFAWRSRASLVAALLAVAIACSGVYYAFFALFFFAVAGAYAALHRRSWPRLASAGVLVGVAVLALVAQWVPSIVYHLQAGANPGAVTRSPVEADIYGFRLSQLLLPGIDHRLAGVAAFFGDYWKLVFGTGKAGYTESYYSVLGVVGALGLIALLVWPLVSLRRSATEAPSRESALMGPLSVFAWSGFVLGTVGGLGAMVGIVFTQIRAYNRVSIFIAFLALFAVALGLDRLLMRAEKPDAARFSAVMVAFAVVLVVGLFDQVVPTMLPSYDALAVQEQSDSAIVGQLQSALPPNAMVFQLPYVPFPEGGATLKAWPGNIDDYEHFRGPLHSTTLRWSYGAMKGRADDAWDQQTSALSADQMVAAVKGAGFSAIWVDRNGYADAGAALEGQLAKATGAQPLVSPDRQIAVFVLAR